MPDSQIAIDRDFGDRVIGIKLPSEAGVPDDEITIDRDFGDRGTKLRSEAGVSDNEITIDRGFGDRVIGTKLPLIAQPVPDGQHKA